MFLLYCITLFVLLIILELDLVPKKLLKAHAFVITFFEFFFFAFYLRSIISKKIVRNVALFAIPIFAIFQIVYYYSAKKMIFDSIPSGIEAIVIISLTMYYFYEQFSASENIIASDKYQTWISLGIMIYLAGTFFFYLLANNMNKSEIIKYWFFTYIFETMKNLLFAYSIVSFYKTKKETKKNQQLPNLDFTL